MLLYLSDSEVETLVGFIGEQLAETDNEDLASVYGRMVEWVTCGY